MRWPHTFVAIALLVGWAMNGFGNWRLGKGRTMLVCFVGFWGGLPLSPGVEAAIRSVGLLAPEDGGGRRRPRATA